LVILVSFTTCEQLKLNQLQPSAGVSLHNLESEKKKGQMGRKNPTNHSTSTQFIQIMLKRLSKPELLLHSPCRGMLPALRLQHQIPRLTTPAFLGMQSSPWKAGMKKLSSESHISPDEHSVMIIRGNTDPDSHPQTF